MLYIKNMWQLLGPYICADLCFCVFLTVSSICLQRLWLPTYRTRKAASCIALVDFQSGHLLSLGCDLLFPLLATLFSLIRPMTTCRQSRCVYGGGGGLFSFGEKPLCNNGDIHLCNTCLLGLTAWSVKDFVWRELNLRERLDRMWKI